MESSQSYLKDLLSQEQEPFALQSFIDERRCQLQRPKRRPPSSATGSPLFLVDVKKKSPLFDLTHAKSNPSAATCLLLEAALRIHGGQQKQQQKRSNKVKQLGLRFFSSLLKKLSQKKPRCDVNVISCTNDYSQQVILAKDVTELEVDGRCEGPLMEDVVIERIINEGETMGATFSSTTETSASTEDQSNSLQAEDQTPETASPERESTAAGGPQSTKKKVLVGEDEGGGGGGGDELQQQEKQQLSPVSVLSFHDDEEEEEEEDDQAHQQSHHQYQGGGLDQEQESFQHSLAIVQRSKDQLMRQIRRFERLAGLDPIQLEKLLSEEDQEPEDIKTGAEWRNLHVGDIYELARLVLESPDDSHCTVKLPMDLKKLLSDLLQNESEGMQELDGLVERVCRKFEAWKEVGCRNVEVLVDLDFRQEGDKWRSFIEQVQDFAIQIELSIFEILVGELFE